MTECWKNETTWDHKNQIQYFYLDRKICVSGMSRWAQTAWDKLCKVALFPQKWRTNDDLMITYKTTEAFYTHTCSSDTAWDTEGKKSEARSDPLDREKSGEHIWIAALAASSCQLLSLAGGEESNGIYTSRQKSRRAPELFFLFFSKLNKSPGWG